MMNLKEWSCWVSDRADAAISHPLGFVSFNAGIAIAYATIGESATNLAISILTADILFITSIARRQRETKLEREIDAVVDAHPQIDEQQLREGA